MALSDLIQEVTGPSELIPLINNRLLELNSLPSGREEGYHVSEFYNMCPRKEVLKTLRQIPPKEKVISPNLRRIFDTGTALHRWYQEKYFGPMGILWGKWRCSRCHMIKWGFRPKNKCDCVGAICVTKMVRDECYPNRKKGGCVHCGNWGNWEYLEVPVSYKDKILSKPIVGHADGLVLVQNKWAILEIKTMNEWGIQKLKQAKQNHIDQAQVYAKLVNMGSISGVPSNIDKPRVDYIVVFYIGKNTSAEKEFWIPVDGILGKSLLAKPLRYDQALKKKVFPNRQDACKTVLSKDAKDCEVSSFCFSKLPWNEIDTTGNTNETK